MVTYSKEDLDKDVVYCWHSDCVGSDRADGGEVETGARGGPPVSSRFLGVSSWDVGAGGRGANPAALLEAGLGH